MVPDIEPALSPEVIAKVREEQRLFGDNGIEPGRLDDLMIGAIDSHVHANPDPYRTRSGDQIEFAIEACQARMAAVLFKCHQVPTAQTAPLVQRVVDEWADAHDASRLRVFGGVALNYSVGGINPEAVEVAARLGARVVWAPTVDSRHYRLLKGLTGGIDVLDDRGRVVDAMKDVLCLVKERDMVLAMSCLGVGERFALIDQAVAIGVTRINVVHPNALSSLMTVEQMKEAADKGAQIELTCGGFGLAPFDWELFMRAYETLGATHIVAATDAGMVTSFRPVAAMRQFIARMLARGIPEDDVILMTKKNPARLLYP